MIPSRLPDLSPERQFIIWCATVAIASLVLVRASFVLVRFRRREDCYPSAWTQEQLNRLHLTRNFVGILLILTWAALLYATPFLPLRYPFSQSNAILLIALLAQTYAWLVMAVPFDWKGSPLARMKFNYVLVGALIWWAALLGITVYMIAAMALPHISPQSPAVPADYAWRAVAQPSCPCGRS